MRICLFSSKPYDQSSFLAADLPDHVTPAADPQLVAVAPGHFVEAVVTR